MAADTDASVIRELEAESARLHAACGRALRRDVARAPRPGHRGGGGHRAGPLLRPRLRARRSAGTPPACRRRTPRRSRGPDHVHRRPATGGHHRPARPCDRPARQAAGLRHEPRHARGAPVPRAEPARLHRLLRLSVAARPLPVVHRLRPAAQRRRLDRAAELPGRCSRTPCSGTPCGSRSSTSSSTSASRRSSPWRSRCSCTGSRGPWSSAASSCCPGSSRTSCWRCCGCGCSTRASAS